MSKWNTFISRIPATLCLQTDAELLLEADLPIIRRFEQRCALNPARSVEARQFRDEITYKRANVARLKIGKARRHG